MTNNSYKNYFKNKKITLIGLGLLGRGIEDAKFLLDCGAELTITDLKTEKELASSIAQLKKYKKIRYVLGKHELEDFENCDMVVKAAGVSLDSPYIEQARLSNVPVVMDESLFVDIAEKLELNLTIIGITGTRGKTTTTHMIFNILKKAKKRVHIGGNIRGMATLPLLAKVKKGDFVVLELSSWQLQGFGELGVSPQVAVLTSFYDDHLNYYGTSDRYWFDKSLIYRFQTEQDFLVISDQVKEYVENDIDDIFSTVITARASDIPETLELHVVGEHMKNNAALALAVARTLSIDDSLSLQALKKFKSPEGRLQFVKNVRGIDIYNDNNATTPEATVFALEALGDASRDHKNIILIAGGADKKLKLPSLVRATEKYVRHTILLDGSGTKRLAEIFEKKNIEYTIVSSIDDAIKQAMNISEEEDTLLFSPAFASFGMFKNEYERNDQFLKIIKDL